MGKKGAMLGDGGCCLLRCNKRSPRSGQAPRLPGKGRKGGEGIECDNSGCSSANPPTAHKKCNDATAICTTQIFKRPISQTDCLEFTQQPRRISAETNNGTRTFPLGQPNGGILRRRKKGSRRCMLADYCRTVAALCSLLGVCQRTQPMIPMLCYQPKCGYTVARHFNK